MNKTSQFRTSIEKYLHHSKVSSWHNDEAYKFEFSHYIRSRLNLERMTDHEVYDLLTEAQNTKFGNSEFKGLQFITKSGRKRAGYYLSIEDIPLLRLAEHGDIQSINWESRTMSYTVLSVWLSILYPEKYYPLGKTGFDSTCSYLFGPFNKSLAKQDLKYLTDLIPYFQYTETLLREYLDPQGFLDIWNEFSNTHQNLELPIKNSFDKIDWIWLTQDFHLFVEREILKVYGGHVDSINISDSTDVIEALEGNKKLRIHYSRERNQKLIKEIKIKALKRDQFLKCEVCSFSFRETYGPLGDGFIEAHHLSPLFESDDPVKTTANDIALVCSNCHRMLHKGDPVYTIEQLKNKLIH